MPVETQDLENADFFMSLAIEEARRAQQEGEVPVGAIVVLDNEVIGKGHNLVETDKNPTRHAEIVAITQACSNLGNWRLDGASLFVTLEPCSMCAGAIALSRISRVYFGASDPRLGAFHSLFSLPETGAFPTKIDFFGGILEDECSCLLTRFFRRVMGEA